MSIKDRIKMFQQFSGNSTPAPSFTAPTTKPTIPQKVTIPTTFQQKPVDPPPQPYKPITSNNSTTGGSVQSPTIVKPSQARKTQQYNTKNISNHSHNNLVSSVFTPPVNPPPTVLVKESSETIVKVTGNGVVDIEPLPKVNAMKKLMEQRNIGLYKKQEDNQPKKKIQETKTTPVKDNPWLKNYGPASNNKIQDTNNKTSPIKQNPWLKNYGPASNNNNSPNQAKQTNNSLNQESPPWKKTAYQEKVAETTHTAEPPKNILPAWGKNTGQTVIIQNQVPTWNNVTKPQVINDGPKETPQIQRNSVGSVRDSARLLAQLFQNSAANQKAKNEQQQALKQREKQQLNNHNAELTSLKNQERHFIPEQNNSQNITASDTFSYPAPQPSLEQTSITNAAVPGTSNAESAPETGDISLAARLKKRKQMRKSNFSSDDD